MTLQTTECRFYFSHLTYVPMTLRIEVYIHKPHIIRLQPKMGRTFAFALSSEGLI